jgi:hypothetical protein
MTGPNGCYTEPFFNTSDVYGHFYGHNGQGSPYEPMPSSHPQHFDVISCLYLHICCADTKSMSSLSGPSSNPIFKAIMSASHDTLVRSGNVTYTSLRTQFVKAQCELEAERSAILTGRNVHIC